jgi:hypothetical protein
LRFASGVWRCHVCIEASSEAGVAFALKIRALQANKKKASTNRSRTKQAQTKCKCPKPRNQKQGASEHKNPLANKRTAGEKIKPCFYE